ncbi:GNAT family N-acetyltransferase [Paenibacillus sp. Y412MC10]
MSGLVVDAEHRRMGVGQKLVRWMHRLGEVKGLCADRCALEESRSGF